MILVAAVGLIQSAWSQVNGDIPGCQAVTGSGGKISNPRVPCNPDIPNGPKCYEPGEKYCWRVQSRCKTVKVKFDKFVVEEFMSAEDTCPYDRVLVSWEGAFKEFCDHSSANKDEQGRGFNQSKDPELAGWFEWQTIDSSEFVLEFKTDSSIEFYGFDMQWECDEVTTTTTTTTTTPTTTEQPTTTTEDVVEEKVVFPEQKLAPVAPTERHMYGHYYEDHHMYQGYDLTDINELMSFLADCSIKALNQLYKDDHCGFADKKMKDKLLKKWGNRFTHLFLSVPKRQRWFSTHSDRNEHETRRCQDPPRKVTTHIVYEILDLKHHDHTPMQNLRELAHIYEEVLDEQFQDCKGPQLVTKHRKEKKFDELVRRVELALPEDCGHLHDHDHHHETYSHHHRNAHHPSSEDKKE